jgi:hypothetical protein
MLFKLLKRTLEKPQAPPPDAAKPQPGPNEHEQLEALIDYCAAQVNERLADDTSAVLRRRAAQFDAIDLGASPLNAFVYHVDMGEAGRIQYRDVAMDTARFDYAAVLRAFVDSVARWQPEAHVVLVTNPGSPLAALAGPKVHVVTLDVATGQPMYERVGAMCAYAHSRAFCADTLFLDSDAFLNGPPEPWLTGEYDVAVTYRDQPGLMPVNEGVMAARIERPQAVQAFFRRYLATYDSLRKDERIEAYYGDIRKWRGGQLTLNAVSRAAHPFCAFRVLEADGVRLRALPCDPFNFSFSYSGGFDARELAAKAVVHFKGVRKDALDAWLQFTRSRGVAAAREAQAAEASPGTPSWLLDPEFMQAAGKAASEPLYFACWAARSCLALEGDFVQVGGDLNTLGVLQRYCAQVPHMEKSWRHLGRLQAKAQVQALPPRIAFAHLDLLAAESPQGCIAAVRERMTPGGMILLQDFARHRARDASLQALVSAPDARVWEHPGGHGLLVHR